jgi:hypothetical protein
MHRTRHLCLRMLGKTDTLMTLLLCVIFMALVPMSQAQEAWKAFLPPQLQDKFSGVVVTPPLEAFELEGPETFGVNVLASPVTTGPQNEPEFATNLLISNFPPPSALGRSIHNAGFNDYRLGDSRCGASRSTNNGTSYVDAGLVPLIPNRTNLNVAGDPDLAWSLEGYVYYSCLYFSRSTGQGTIGVSRSTNGGANYPAPVIVAAGSASVFNDKEFIAVDANSRSPFEGRVYVCYTEFSSAGAFIKFKRSETFGTSWLPGAGIILSTGGSSQGCDIATGPSGDVYVVWLDFTTDLCNGTLRIRRSTDGGVTFGSIVTIGPVGKPDPCNLPSRAGLAAYRTNNFPRIATDRLGHVFVVFSSTLTYEGQASIGLDIWIWRASSGLVPLTDAFVKVNAGRTARDQHWPAIAVSDNPAPPPASYGTTSSHGRLHVCFIDRSFASTVGDWDTACTHSDIPDGPSASWIVPVRVSDCSSFSADFGGSFIGDYIGVAMSRGLPLGNGHLHPVFPRACSGAQDIFSDSGTPTEPPPVAPEEDTLPADIP